MEITPEKTDWRVVELGARCYAELMQALLPEERYFIEYDASRYGLLLYATDGFLGFKKLWFIPPIDYRTGDKPMNDDKEKWPEITSPAIDAWNRGQPGEVVVAAGPAKALGIDSAFAVHVLNEGGIKMSQEIAWSLNATWRILQSLCPPGRELAIVHTKLEEACFFANKAMASDLANQK